MFEPASFTRAFPSSVSYSTSFLLISDANRTINDWRTCNDGIGVKVKPKQGDAVLFWSATPDLQLDDHALHGMVCMLCIIALHEWKLLCSWF